MTSFRDVELLSAYLDGRLSPSDFARLESRLSSDASLRAAIHDLRAARGLLHQLPQRRAPRNFTLTPKMAGIKPPEPRAYPTLRFATVLATLFFVATFVINGLAPAMNSSFAAAPAPGYGYGGGGGGGPESAPQQAPAATEAPILPFAAISPTETTPRAGLSLAPTEVTPSADQFLAPTEVTPSENLSIAPTEAPYAKSAAPELGNSAPSRVPNEAPVPFVWQIGLAILAIILGAAAWLIRRTSESKFHKQWK